MNRSIMINLFQDAHISLIVALVLAMVGCTISIVIHSPLGVAFGLIVIFILRTIQKLLHLEKESRQ